MNTDKIYAESIAKEYAVTETSKVVALKKLDAKVKNPCYIFTYTTGIVGTLIFGTGMCLAMKVIGPKSIQSFILGIIVGVLGMIIIGINYPLYKKLLAKRKAKYVFEIMELAKEIVQKE